MVDRLVIPLPRLGWVECPPWAWAGGRLAATAAGEGPILVGAWVDEMAGAIASGGVRTMIVMPSVAATMAAAGGTEAAVAAITCAEGRAMVAGTVTGATGIGSVIATGTGSGTGEAETAVDGVGREVMGAAGIWGRGIIVSQAMWRRSITRWCSVADSGLSCFE